MKKIGNKIAALFLAICLMITSMNITVISAEAAEANAAGLKMYIEEALPGVNQAMEEKEIPLSMDVDNAKEVIKIFVHDKDVTAVRLIDSMTALTDLFKYEGIESVVMAGVDLREINTAGSINELVNSITPILVQLGAPTIMAKLTSYKIYTLAKNQASVDAVITLKNKDVVTYTIKFLEPEAETPSCPDCGSKDHTTHPTCPDCGSKDHTTHPTCPDCGSKDHTTHPICPVCGSKDHTKHPTCPTCGSTEHITHPYEGKVSKLKIASKSTVAIKLTWSAPDKKYTAPKGYEVQQISANGKQIKTITTTKKEYTFKSLNSGSVYTYKVTPYILNGKTKVYGKTVTVKGITTPKKVTLSKATGAKKAISATWNTTTATGYQLVIATNKKFTKGVKKYTVTSTAKKSLSKKISGLKAKKTYYVRVRAFTKNGNTISYSAWSKVKTVKTK